MKFYITKYALTKGILIGEGYISETCPDIVSVNTSDSSYMRYFYGSEWHTDLNNAKIHAELMRKKKIEFLRKQIARLEKMEF